MIKGVIEGFYGHAWSWLDRNSYPEFLKAIGYNTYLYAPKSDAFLRNDWQSPWPQPQWQALALFSQRCSEHGIRFGVGLSPLGLSEDIEAGLLALDKKLAQIRQLSPRLIAILFDDMTGDDPALAERQLLICRHIESQLPDSTELLVCPSYYSTDPVLEQHFGKMPQNYWSDLGSGLSARWHVFWTGQHVVSLEYETNDLEAINHKFQRKPLLWDNYPVNDGRLLWPFINTLAKPRWHLEASVAGILHNPMNQAWCSKVAIAELAGFGDEICDLLNLDQDLWTWFDQAREEMQFHGLDKMTTQTKQQLLQCAALSDHPLATEVKNWLQGFYKFDPACLT